MASGVRKPYSPGPHRPSILAVAADGSRGVCAVPGWTSSRENMPSPAQIRQPLQGEARGTAGPGIVIGVSEARRRRNLLLALCPAGVRMGSFCAGCVLSWCLPFGKEQEGETWHAAACCGVTDLRCVAIGAPLGFRRAAELNRAAASNKTGERPLPARGGGSSRWGNSQKT